MPVMRAKACVGFAACVLSLAVSAAECPQAEQHVSAARAAAAAGERAQSLALAEQALTECPGYDTYQLLGTLLAQSSTSRERKRAVTLLISAHEAAPSDAARARTLYEYASLLTRDDDPQNAYPLIKEAQRLDPAAADIAALAAQVEARVRAPTQPQLVRGLRDSIYQPLRVAAVKANPPAPRTSAGPAINIPINFLVGSTLLDEQTAPNVRVLAQALSDDSLKGRRFVLIGHADVRGDERANMVLSMRRAEAIAQALMLAHADLTGRIRATGRGELEPIDLGVNENAHRANRRLQVVLE